MSSKVISATELANIIVSEDYGKTIFTVDCRSCTSYKSAHVRAALNMLFHSQIMRRRLLTSKNCAAHLSNGLRHVTNERLANLTVVLYGAYEINEKAQVSDTQIQFSCLQANVDEKNDFARVLYEKIKNCEYVGKVLLLRDGFSNFVSQYPDLCESSNVPPTPDVAPTGRCLSMENCGEHPMSAPTPPLTRPSLPISTSHPSLSLVIGRPKCPSPSEGSKPPAQITQLFDHVFLGSQEDALNPTVLKRYDITKVINLSDNGPKSDLIPDDELHFKRIPIHDSYQAKICPHFDGAYEFIESAKSSNDKVLIHCLAGISRSPTLAMAYVMRSRLLTCDQAYQFVKNKRPTVSPNLNFMGQLFEYERQLRDQKILPPCTRPRSNIVFDCCADPVVERLEQPNDRNSERALSKSASVDFSVLNQPISEATTIPAPPVETRKRPNESGPLALPSRPRKLMQNGCMRRMTANEPTCCNPQLPSPSTEFSKLDISLSNPCFNSEIPSAPQAMSCERTTTAENPVFALAIKMNKQPSKMERPTDLTSKNGHSILPSKCSWATMLGFNRKNPSERPTTKNPKSTTHGGRLRLRRFPMLRTPATVNVPTTVPEAENDDADSGVASGSSIVYSSTSTDDSEGLERVSPDETQRTVEPTLRESDESEVSSVEISVQ
ncbi:Protein-tyrosine-phosphatase [Aphelenchoides besseyi]|nr:Protein-tyrosine-phosphatase [Aphelenchoides besseyi]KAI6227982.1 Protein-tyrosine-phosphatase [Aphelenchoides besseyi]